MIMMITEPRVHGLSLTALCLASIPYDIFLHTCVAQCFDRCLLGFEMAQSLTLHYNWLGPNRESWDKRGQAAWGPRLLH